MKLLILISVVLFSALLVHAQTSVPAPEKGIGPKFEYEKECGSPLTESNAYAIGSGKVTRILDGKSIALMSETGKTATVYLAGIDPKGNDGNIIKFLSATVLGKQVTLVGNKEKESESSFFAVIFSQDEEGIHFELGRRLLEKGLAGFVEPAYTHSVSDYTMCVYRQVVEKAKKEKIGIWAK